jgi:hypothetical protein
MKQNDYKIVDIETTMNDLKEMLMKEHQKYSKRMASGYEWTGEDFANLYYANLALLDIVKKQDKMINNIYDILDRHESGLG